MTKPGIPIPTKPNGRLCGSCGVTGSHVEGCRERAEEGGLTGAQQIAAIRVRVTDLEAMLRELCHAVSRQAGRIDALEAVREDPAEK